MTPPGGEPAIRPRFDFSLNIVSVANFAALLALLGTGLTTYTSIVSNWNKIEARLDSYNEQFVQMQRRLEEGAADRKKLSERDTELQIMLVTSQSQTNSRLATVEAELRLVGTTLNRLDAALVPTPAAGAVLERRKGK